MGAFHFVSRGVGLEIWNGISTMIFSVLSGVMYLRLNRKCLYSTQAITRRRQSRAAHIDVPAFLLPAALTNDRRFFYIAVILLH